MYRRATRWVALILILVLALGMLPAGAMATAETKVTVNFTAQAEGAFLFAPQFDAEVSSGLAESYGFTDSVTDGVSALDVLVKAHEVMLGTDTFTSASVGDYLVVESGTIKKLFGIETTASSFIINGGFPNDGVEGDYGYGGYNITQAPVNNSDFVEFLIYQDQEYYLDNIVWFCKDGKAVSEFTAMPSSQVTLTLKGLSYVWYGANYPDADAMHTQGGTAICRMQLAWVDVTTGTVTGIENCLTDSTDGSVTVTMPATEGIYYLSVNGTQTDDSDVPAIMSLTKVTVSNETEPAPVVSCDLTALSVTNLTGDATKELTPSFSSDVTSYTTAEQAYSTNNMDLMFKVLVTAAEGATVTAKLGETAVDYNQYMGGFVFNGSNTLKPGDNVVTITVTNGSDTKTYTVTIPMKDSEGNAPAAPAPAPKADSVGFSFGNDGTNPITLDPAFTSDGTTYSATICDRYTVDGSVYTNVTLADGLTAKWKYKTMGSFTDGPAVTSGTAQDHTMADLYEKAWQLEVTNADGAVKTYTFNFNVVLTLKDLKINGATVTGFDPEIYTYTVSVPQDTEKVSLLAVPSDDNNYVGYEGDYIENTATEITLDNSGTTTVTLTAENDSEDLLSTYTLTIKADGAVTPVDPADEAVAVMDAIAAKYAESGIASDGNAPWLAGDMAAYAKAFPDTENTLSDARKQAYLDKLIPTAAAATKPSDLAKYIIAFRAMGYDARKVVTADGTTVDLVKKLTDLVDDTTNTAVTNQYTLPYVIVALRQGQDYATQAQMDYLVNAAVSTKSKWLSTSWGTDGATPMMMALATYSNKSDVKTALDEAVAAVKAKQNAETGSLGSAASDGLALAAFSALGIDPATIKAENSTKSLVDGLMAQASDTKDGFKPTNNTFSTEQGFRGLVAQALMKQKNGPAQIYDFADMPMHTARMSAQNCPVEFSVVPADATVEVKLADAVQTAASPNYYDLAAGSYTYTVSKAGYRDAAGTIEVTADDVTNHTKKDISVSLVSQPAGGDDAKDLTITVKVLTHDENACGGKWTYKANADKYTTELVNTTVTVKSGQTAFDAFALAMEAANVPYTEKTSGYISEISGHAEFGHNSPNSGWQYMIGSQLPDVSCREYTLTSNVTMTWFYTDDYTQEKGSEQWSGGGTSSSTATDEPKVEITTDKTTGETTAAVELPKDADQATVSIPAKDIAPNQTLNKGNVLVAVDKDGKETVVKKSVVDGETVRAILKDSCTVKVVDNTKTFTDTAGHWAEDSIAFAASHELFNGTGSDRFSPDLPMNRAMLATVLYRLEDAAAQGTSPFDDVAEGMWYTDAVIWGSQKGIVTGTGTGFEPDRAITRQEIVTMFYRYAKVVGLDTGKTSDLKGYTDAANVADWADAAMRWAVGVGLVNGKTADTLAPEAVASRAEVATLMERLISLMVK